jgi:hypothetical protein
MTEFEFVEKYPHYKYSNEKGLGILTSKVTWNEWGKMDPIPDDEFKELQAIGYNQACSYETENGDFTDFWKK